MTLLLVFATFSIFFSFLCSILEAVLLSVTTTFIEVKKSENKVFAFQLEQLKKDGVIIIEPGEGWLSCRVEGAGRMAEPAEIQSAIGAALAD